MHDQENSTDAENAVHATGPNDALVSNINRFSRYRPTVLAGLQVIAASLMLPAMLVLLIWQLGPFEEQMTLRGSICRGLVWVVPVLLVSLIIGKSLRPNGLAENQFGWTPALTDSLLKTINSLIWFYLPFQFLYVAIETFDSGKYFDSLGRMIFIAAMAALGWGFWGTRRCMAIAARRREAVGWSFDLRRICLFVIALTPLALIVMASAGYYFTAVQLSWRLIWTVLIMIGVAMIAGMVSRLLLITQFRIKLRQLQRDEDGAIQHQELIDISQISGQVNRLLRVTSLVAMVLVGWQIWAHVLPAMGYLDQVELWTTKIVETGVLKPITLRHLLMAFGLLAITFVLSSNLPGLLEITLLDRLPLDKGGRYAISFVLRYVVGVAGMLMAFQLVGFSWNSVQWLAAGLTVGLGFGLQEIFANLVSGIIILVERPIRVGDWVTVNGVTGTVTRMQLRATTIKDLDHRELIVPNKKFITEDVMNWTLSDRLSRLIFHVGIAYGSDTVLAEKTLYETVRRHSAVLRDPPPRVVFNKFGESSLDFELRVVIPFQTEFSEIIHKMNMSIDAAFRENGIEIAFPQQDLHIKSGTAFPPSPNEHTDGMPPTRSSSPSVSELTGALTSGIVQETESPETVVRLDVPRRRAPSPKASVFKLDKLRGSDFDPSDQHDVTLPN